MPKINLYGLKTSLRQGLMPAYLISGDETLLVEEAIKAIRQSATQKGHEEVSVFHIEASLKWEQVFKSAINGSLLAERNMVVLRSSGSLSKDACAGLLKLLSLCGEHCIMIVQSQRFASKVASESWYKDFLKKGLHVPVWPVEPNHMPSWIKQRASSIGVKLSSDGIATMGHFVEGNIMAAAQELEKLYLCDPKRTWNSSAILEMISDSSQYKVFDLVDSVLQRKLTISLKTLSLLRQEGVSPLLVLGALQKEFVTLLSMSMAVAEGLTAKQAVQKWRVLWKRARLVENVLNTTSPDILETIIASLTYVDQAVKGLMLTDAWHVLENLIADFIGMRKAQAVEFSGENILDRGELMHRLFIER